MANTRRATADRQLTVADLEYTQYMVYDVEADTMTAMTKDNCNTESWIARDELDNPVTKENKLVAFLWSLMRWFTNLFKLIREAFTK